MNTNIPVNSVFRKISSSTMIIVGSLFLAYILFGLSLGWGIYFGMAIMLAAGLFLLIAGTLRLRGKTLLPAGRFTLVRKVLSSGIILFILIFVIIEGLIIVNAVTFENKKAEYLLIPGAALLGERPSLELLYRLDRALEYLKAYPDTKVVASGGQGSGESIAEADYIKKYLAGHGVYENMIIVENRSTNTYENISFSMKLIKERDDRKGIKLAIVTNDFHVFRSKLLAGRQGITAYGVPARTPLYIIPNHYIREFFAVIKSVLLD